VHELAVTQSIVETVTEHAGAAQVTCVRIRIGLLCGVIPHAVRFCFEAVTAGTTLQNAELVIAEQPGMGLCHTCDRTLCLTDLILRCPCGSADVAVTAGRELTIESIEVI
jgi:hydrogenase nickel incorporation protein HypA/HybF